MKSDKVRQFIALAGNKMPAHATAGTLELRRLGAGLILSETLEFITRGLGLSPIICGQLCSDAQALEFEHTASSDLEEMLDGLADVAYTMECSDVWPTA
jgi:hypothetical protein